jgi:hypothetical protein
LDSSSGTTSSGGTRIDAAALVRAAILAPSSHNTQPWWFRVAGNQISVYADRTRALPVNDPDDRELTISCGCALMNLRVAAARARIHAKVHILPDLEDPDRMADVSLEEGPVSSSEAYLFPAVAERRTYRKRFLPLPVPANVAWDIVDAASVEGAWLGLLTSDEARREAAGLVEEGDAVQWANPSWRRELAAWMHPRRSGDGLALPGLVAPVAQMVVRTFDMGDGVAARDRQLADESPVLAVLGTARDAVRDWLAAGQALQRALLRACMHGLQASFLNQPVQVAPLRPKLQTVLGRTGFPQILLRLGFPADEPPAAPRRAIDDVIG